MSDEIDDDGDVPTFNQTDDSPDEEAAPKRGTPEGFTGDEEEHDAPGSGPRRRREYSSKTRELFKAASAKLKAQLAAGESVDAFEVAIQDDPDPDEADLEAAAVDPETPDPAAEAAATTEEAAKPPEGAPDPRVIKEWEAINEERRAIAAERAAVAALRQENDYEELRERFVESPGTAAADLIKRWSPGATENEVRELAIDLITELSGQVLGVTISPEAKERLARRSSDRAVSAWKAQQAREKAEAPKRQAEAEQAARERGAITRIDQELKAAAQQFPFLAMEDEVADRIWSVMKTAYLKDGTTMKWQEAAATLEKEFQTQASGWYAKRKHLLSTAPGKAPVQQQPKTSVPQGDRSSISRSRTLTNAAAASVPSSPRTSEEEIARPFDPRAHRSRSLGKLAASVKKAAAPE
jgi:hypothetical protein